MQLAQGIRPPFHGSEAASGLVFLCDQALLLSGLREQHTAVHWEVSL